MPLQLQGEVGSSLGPDELRSPALALLLAALENASPLLRCVAAEGLARLVQVLGDPGFTISASLLCFDRYGDAHLLLSANKPAAWRRLPVGLGLTSSFMWK